jgi:hypothetical protein
MHRSLRIVRKLLQVYDIFEKLNNHRMSAGTFPFTEITNAYKTPVQQEFMVLLCDFAHMLKLSNCHSSFLFTKFNTENSFSDLRAIL